MNKMLLGFLIYTLSSPWAFASAKKTPFFKYFVSDECTIYDNEGSEIKKFNGDLCQFFDDGSFLRKNEDTDLDYFNSKSEKKWMLKGFYHHLTSLAQDQKNILAIGSEGINDDRIDNLQIIDRLGNVKKIFHLSTVIDQLNLKKIKLDWNLETLKNFKNEYTHVNSFYEIPENRSKESYLKKGNFIVTERSSNQVFILNQELSKIIFSFQYSKFSASAHDAQIMENGHLILFNNESITNDVLNQYSTIDEIDMTSNKLVWRYKYKNAKKFRNPTCGSIQVLADGNLFFTASLKDEGAFAFVVSKSTKKELTRIKLNYDPSNCHRVRVHELDLFLKNNQSL